MRFKDENQAAYRFFDHDNISRAMLLANHFKATAERMRSEPVVLAVQDTTTLNYSDHNDTEGLGPVNQQRASLGMFLHSTMAFTPGNIPLGFVNVTSHRRERYGRTKHRNDRKLEEKESRRWLESFQATSQLVRLLGNTLIVNVSDREGDIYEMFAAALEPGAASVLVRAQHNRQVVNGRAKLLWEHMRAHDSAGIVEIAVPRHGKEPARRARCQVRFGEVVLAAPLLKEDKPALRVWFVEVCEIDPTTKRPIVWRLLTTVPVRTLDEAMERVRWYTVRWQIEVFHRTLKTGCGVEGLQLGSTEKLDLAIGLKMVVAWRIMALVQCSRTTPDAPATVLLSALEIAILVALKKVKVKEKGPTLREAVHAIAGIGGFLGRRGDGEPGVMTLWHGLTELQAMTRAVEAVKNCG